LIQLEWSLTSDYASLTITIPIIKEHFQTKKHIIVKNSDEEKLFIEELIRVIKSVNTSNISNIELLEIDVLNLTHSVERT